MEFSLVEVVGGGGMIALGLGKTLVTEGKTMVTKGKTLVRRLV